MTLIRSLVLVGCMAGLAVTTVPATAQQSRTYAPDNLNTLNAADRARVIRQEYSEQARGRQIPDDQLRFYLDQVRLSNWRFSQVKADIAASLGTSGGGWRPPHNGPGMGETIRCESNDGRSRSCDTPWRGQSRLVKQLSSARCVEGSSWFSNPGRVTVSNGCRAEFERGFGGGHGNGNGNGQGNGAGNTSLQCESTDGRLRTCGSNLYGVVSLERQLSSKTCVHGQNFGLRNGSVWVNDGCRGVFLVRRGLAPAEPAYSVTCSSDKGRYTTCAWDARRGMPRLLQTLSNTACTEGRTWGYSPRSGLWVNGGCRGRFGNR